MLMMQVSTLTLCLTVSLQRQRKRAGGWDGSPVMQLRWLNLNLHNTEFWMVKYQIHGLMSLLRKLKDIQFSLDQMHPDTQKGMDAHWLNRAKNELGTVLADAERRVDKKAKEQIGGGKVKL
jgi:hypothetical protein